MSLRRGIGNLSIKWKLVLMLAVLLTLTGNAVTGYIAYSLQSSLKKEMYMRAEVLGAAVAERVAEPVLLNDVITADEIMRDCTKRSWVSYCAVKDREGKVLAGSFEGSPPEGLLQSSREELMFVPGYGELWEFSFPVLEGEAGNLFIGLPWSPVRETIVYHIRNSIFIGLMLSLASIGLSYAVSSRFLAPIAKLTSMTREVATGKTGNVIPAEGPPCNEIIKCEKSDCECFGDRTIPCWLRSGTLCLGEPSGVYAEKISNCRHCQVYRKYHGDEVSEMIYHFNLMSVSLKKSEQDNEKHIREIESLNQTLKNSNLKLGMLLEASRLTSSTLELEQILSLSMKIILNVTSLRVGIILLLEKDPDKKCYEYFGCNAYDCAAYKSATACWRLSGTMCHGVGQVLRHISPAGEDSETDCPLTCSDDTHEKIRDCSCCTFFANEILVPKMTAGLSGDGEAGRRLKNNAGAVHKALFMGSTIVGHSSENPFGLHMDTATEIAMPLGMKEQIFGVIYLASDEEFHYTNDDMEFFQTLEETVSAGIINSWIFEDVETSYLQTVTALANAVEAKDVYTRGHSERVAEFSDVIAEACSLSRQEREYMRFAAVLHDVGKIGIGREVLLKHGKLDSCEEEEIRTHPEKGVKILDPVHFLRPVISSIRHHHERFDGTGYPDGLRGKEIPFKARILSVADAWDAMLSTRPYRKALSFEEARDELLRCAGSHFDPELVEVFVKVMEKDSTGDCVN